MKIVNLGESNSILNRFVSELRDVNIQKDSLRFRRNIERIGEIMAYEISKDFAYSQKDIQSNCIAAGNPAKVLKENVNILNGKILMNR